MPVTFTVATHAAEKVKIPEASSSGISAFDFLRKTTAGAEAATVLRQFGLTGVSPGFVPLIGYRSAPIRYAETRQFTTPPRLATASSTPSSKPTTSTTHLIIRPDDVWLAILAQFNAFVNAPGNAERLRASFVSHEGKKQLTIESAHGLQAVDFGEMARDMGKLLEKHVSDPALRAWTVPAFSTTTEIDRTCGAVLLMATLREYFAYTFSIRCGLPRVTLEGEKSDWEEIGRRVEKLAEYGIETIGICCRVAAFDAPEADLNINFWQCNAHFQPGGSGPSYDSGWIIAFTVFDGKGKWQGFPLDSRQKSSDVDPASLSPKKFFARYSPNASKSSGIVLAETPFHKLDSSKIPVGYGSVDVRLDVMGEIYPCAMVAGVVGMQTAGEERDGLRPMVGWWMYDKEVKE